MVNREFTYCVADKKQEHEYSMLRASNFMKTQVEAEQKVAEAKGVRDKTVELVRVDRDANVFIWVTTWARWIEASAAYDADKQVSVSGRFISGRCGGMKVMKRLLKCFHLHKNTRVVPTAKPPPQGPCGEASPTDEAVPAGEVPNDW